MYEYYSRIICTYIMYSYRYVRVYSYNRRSVDTRIFEFNRRRLRNAALVLYTLTSTVKLANSTRKTIKFQIFASAFESKFPSSFVVSKITFRLFYSTKIQPYRRTRIRLYSYKYESLSNPKKTCLLWHAMTVSFQGPAQRVFLLVGLHNYD